MNSDIDLEQKIKTGLTKEQVESRVREGLVNGELDIKTKSVSQIIKDNLFTLFNLMQVILVTCVILVGSWKNTLFFFTAVINFFMGVFQEIRAKRTIDRLSILSAPKVHAVRDGAITEIQVKDIVLGEIMEIKNGNQIPADAVVLSGECQVNESLLTGESTPIFKKEGDHLLSGSFVISGKVIAEAEHIGSENYVNKITLGAKYYKKEESVIMTSINTIVKIIGFFIVPMAALQVWKQIFDVTQTLPDAVVKIVASLTSMVPAGLVLLVSLKLAESVIRLSRHNTLVQDLYSVENLSRVDVLCLDKTGTITEGKMQVEEVIPLAANADDAIKALCEDLDDENATIGAIREYYHTEAKVGGAKTIPFSSDKKWSLVHKEGKGTLILGAPEFVSPESAKKHEELIREHLESAKRVLMVAISNEAPKGRELPNNIRPVAVVIIGDKVRAEAKDTLNYFKEQGVTLKVISGDNPRTVSVVAQEAGLFGYEKYIDASTLTSYEDIEAAVDDYTIFGRVTPYQKLDIIKALKAKGHTVAMTGDGVNDVLALKEADCSIAMNSGSDAAKNVSNLVLMDSNFSSLPMVVAEGRKCINNLQRSAALFLTKTTYSTLLTVLFLFLAFPYPFESIQVTLMGSFTIGIPSFLLALEPNVERIKDHFIRNVFSIAVPSGVMIFLALTASIFISRFALGASDDQISTVAVYTNMLVSFVVIFDICGKLNLWKGGMIIGCAGCALLAIILFFDLVSLVPLTASMYLVIALTAAVFAFIHIGLFRVILSGRAKKRGAE